VAVGHVGDSRLYLWRGGTLQALTEDHSLVMDQVRHGLITREQAEKSSFHNILTRALGTEESVRVDMAEHPVVPGDILLLCSDGLTKMLKDDAIAQVLAGAPSPDAAVETLVAEARRLGGLDNVTVAIAKVAADRGGWLRRLARMVKRGR
jgi:protein phosphatase